VAKPRRYPASILAPLSLALLLSAAQSADGQHPDADRAWNSQRALAIAGRAIEARQFAFADSSLRSFEASVQGHVYFLGAFEGDRRLVRGDQVALNVLWQAPNRALQTIVGRRHERRLPTNIRYHIDHLSLILDNFGDRIRMGEGEEVRNVLHPAAPGALRFYDYRLVDSLEIRVRDQTTRVYQLAVRPSDPGQAAVVGAVFVDRSSGAIARMTVTFTGAAYRDPDLEYINLDLRSGLWEGRYWLPAEQEVEIRRQISWLDFPVGGVIRTRLEVLDYSINQARVFTLAPGERVATLPPASLSAFDGWTSDLFAGPVTPDEQTGIDLSDVHRRARELVKPGTLMGTSRFQLYLPNASAAARTRRAEGILLGAGGAVRFDERVRTDLWLGYPFGRGRVEAVGGIRFSFAQTDLSGEVMANRLADVGPFQAASGAVSTFALALEGEDYTDPYFEDGVEFRLTAPALGGRATLGFFYLVQESAELVVHGTALNGNLARSVRPIDPGTMSGIDLGLEYSLGNELGATWQLDLDFEGAVGGWGDFGFSRLTAVLSANGDAPGSAWGWGARLAGMLSGGTIPAQRLTLLGGRGTVPGYGFREWGGDRAAFLEADVSRTVLFPWVRLRAFGAAGWSDLTSVGRAAAATLGVAETGGIRPSLGAGLGIFYDIVRFDVARGLDGGDWEVMLSVKRSLWPRLASVPGGQHLSLSLRRQSGSGTRAAFLVQRVPPLQRVARGVTQRPELKAGGQGAIDAHPGESLEPVSRRDPGRHVTPRLDFMLSQEICVHPGERRVRGKSIAHLRQHRADLHGVTGRAEHAGDVFLRQPDHPGGKVARIDVLDWILRLARRHDFAATIYPHRPVGEAIRRVPGPDNQTGPDDGRAAGERGLRLLLAQGFQRSVRRTRDFLDGGIFDSRDRSGLIHSRLAEVRECRDRGHVDVLRGRRRQQSR
jgi:hypothetical protein